MRGLAFFLILGWMGLGCESEEEPAAFKVTSAAFSEGGVIPRQHTCFGANLSPPLQYTGVSGPVKSYAVIVDEPGALGGVVTHWLVWGIPKDTMILHEQFAADTIAEQNPDDWDHIHFGPNFNGKSEYSGPCPNDENEHTYRFRVFALDETLSQPADDVESADDLESMMKGRIIGMGELTGTSTK